MRRFLLYLAERLARDPSLRARFHAALEVLGTNGNHHPPGDRVIDHADPSLSRPMSRPALLLGSGDGTRARRLIWILGSALLLVWVLLAGGAYGLGAVFGDWATTEVNGIIRGIGLPSELAGPIASIATLVQDLVGPALAVIGVVVSAVILIVTVLAAGLLGLRTRG